MPDLNNTPNRRRLNSKTAEGGVESRSHNREQGLFGQKQPGSEGGEPTPETKITENEFLKAFLPIIVRVCRLPSPDVGLRGLSFLIYLISYASMAFAVASVIESRNSDEFKVSLVAMLIGWIFKEADRIATGMENQTEQTNTTTNLDYIKTTLETLDLYIPEGSEARVVSAKKVENMKMDPAGLVKSFGNLELKTTSHEDISIIVANSSTLVKLLKAVQKNQFISAWNQLLGLSKTSILDREFKRINPITREGLTIESHQDVFGNSVKIYIT